MAPRRAIPPLPVAIPAEAVTDHPCEKCGHPMKIRRSGEGNWFYGCSKWPDCHFTFDADQRSGAPIYHTRYGIPFLANGFGDKRQALFEALKRDSFNIEAGQKLEQ